MREYGELLKKVCDTFGPGRFTVSLVVEEEKGECMSFYGIPRDLNGYELKDRTFVEHEGGANTCVCHFVRK